MSAMISEATDDPAVHSQNLQRWLGELITHAREDVGKVKEPQLRALLETTAEVLAGLQNAFAHYDRKTEPAWQTAPAPRS